MSFLFFIVLLVCLALYFYTAAQSALALKAGSSADVFVIDRFIYKVTKTAGSFFFVRFLLVGIVTYPTQLIYNAGLKKSEDAASLYALIYVAALSVAFLLLALRNRRAFGAQKF